MWNIDEDGGLTLCREGCTYPKRAFLDEKGSAECQP